jgi:NADH-quinone oxidoreductase subunit G
MGSTCSRAQTGLAYDASSLGAVNFNTTSRLETADSSLLVGTNPRGSHARQHPHPQA